MSRLILLVLLFSGLLSAAEASDGQPLWMRYPAVSPDGETIAFTYGGQLWTVPASGGDATALTTGEFYTTSPVWSPDGGSIAFASKRHGNLDVYVMPAKGGDMKRLTQHSADDRPTAFSPDGKLVYFSSPRLGSARTVHVGTYEGSDQLYSVPAAGGRSRLVLPTPALFAVPDATGNQLLYENRPVYENEWRKGAVSDGAHDVWHLRCGEDGAPPDHDFPRGGSQSGVVDGREEFLLSERTFGKLERVEEFARRRYECGAGHAA